MNNKLPIISSIWLILFWLFMEINPLDRHDWAMENILLVIFFIIFIIIHKKFTISNLSFILITIFLTLHIIGAHYTYAKVPAGFFLAEILDIKRNHFDRIVHFAFGFFLTYQVQEFLNRTTEIKSFMSFYLPINIIPKHNSIDPYDEVFWR